MNSRTDAGIVSGTPLVSMPTDAHAVRTELHRELIRQHVHRGERHRIAAHRMQVAACLVIAQGVDPVAAAKGEDHTRPLRHHVPGRGSGRHELGCDRLVCGSFDVGDRELDQLGALPVLDRHHVERDVDASRLRNNGIDERVDCGLVERVDDRGLRAPAARVDVVRHCLERSSRTPREVHRCAFTRERARRPRRRCARRRRRSLRLCRRVP